MQRELTDEQRDDLEKICDTVPKAGRVIYAIENGKLTGNYFWDGERGCVIGWAEISPRSPHPDDDIRAIWVATYRKEKKLNVPPLMVMCDIERLVFKAKDGDTHETSWAFKLIRRFLIDHKERMLTNAERLL